VQTTTHLLRRNACFCLLTKKSHHGLITSAKNSLVGTKHRQDEVPRCCHVCCLSINVAVSDGNLVNVNDFLVSSQSYGSFTFIKILIISHHLKHTYCRPPNTPDIHIILLVVWTRYSFFTIFRPRFRPQSQRRIQSLLSIFYIETRIKRFREHSRRTIDKRASSLHFCRHLQ
jgi:hypothetical protein